MQKQKILLYSDKQNTSAASVSPNSSLLTILYADFSAGKPAGTLTGFVPKEILNSKLKELK